jgi:hypothetical protein
MSLRGAVLAGGDADFRSPSSRDVPRQSADVLEELSTVANVLAGEPAWLVVEDADEFITRYRFGT